VSGDQEAPIGFRDLVFSDFRRYRRTSPSWLRIAMTVPFVPGLLASLVLRTQQCLVQAGHIRLAWFMRTVGIVITGADFVPGARVGLSVMLSHPTGVVIGPGSRVGDNVTFAGGVTLGVKDFDPRLGDQNPDAAYPTVGDGVFLGAHAVLLGGVVVGHDAAVGANSVVTSDVEALAVVAGAPARRVSSRPVLRRDSVS